MIKNRIEPFYLCMALLALFGCAAEPAPPGPTYDMGGTTVTKYVSIGNSLTAGYQSGALYESGQMVSYPNLISQQMQKAGANLGKFEQPIWGDPGNLGANGKAARMELLSLTGPSIGPAGREAGVPKNSGLNRPFDNLGIPAAKISDFLDETLPSTRTASSGNPFFFHVLRDTSYGKSVLAQAKKLNPDVITFWLGNNDVLLYAIYGGVAVLNGSVIPNAPTSTTTFSTLYNQALDTLRKTFPNAKIVVGTIPDVRSIPYFVTVNSAVFASLKGAIPLSYQKHGSTGVGDGTSFLNEVNGPLLTLGSGPYAALIGTSTDKWYKDNGIPVPAGIVTTALFGIDVRNPIPDALILDSLEIAEIGKAVASYNLTIKSAAARNNAAVVDINAIFNSVKANGITWGNQKYTADYVSGGLFSLDGIHPTGKGAGFIANEFIKTMNSTYSMKIPLVNVTDLPGVPAPLAKYVGGKTVPIWSSDALRNMYQVFQP